VEEVDWAFRITGKDPKKQRWFPMIHTWAEHDELPGIDYRLAAGPGIGMHVRDDSKMRVTLEGGFAYTDERQIHPQKFATLFFDPSVRWTINQKTSLQEKVNFRYNAERSRDVRVHSESDLNVQMTQRVSLSFSVTLDFDNEPVQGHKKFDMQTSTNVSFNLQHGHQ
jgi:putative salt-induced outer membrane protein YdiY